jgi:hypothetical protein
MSDTEQIPIKRKVVMTQQRLDNLKIARESALAKKKQMKQLSENKKELKKVEFETELDNSKKALEKTKVETLKEEIVEPKVEPTLIKEKPKKINKPTPKPITPSSSSSEESSSSSSEEEEKIIYNKKKPKKKIQKEKTKYEMSNEITKNELYDKIQKDNYNKLFSSMFPQYNLI